MKWKLDENLPTEIVALLESRGHDAVTVLHEAMGGAPDETVFAACQKEGRILLTLDTDFADIRRYGPRTSAGVVVFRLKSHSKSHVLRSSEFLLGILEKEKTGGCLWIVEENRVRVRGRH